MRYTSIHSAKDIILDYAFQHPVLYEQFCKYLNAHIKNECADKPVRSDVVNAINGLTVNCSKRQQQRMTQLLRWVEQGCPVPEYEIRGCYGGQWEAVTAEPTYSLAKAQLKCYRGNERGTSFTIKQQTEYLYEKGN